jgi:hypothetical protein
MEELLKLNESDFKNLFITTLKQLIKENEDKKNKMYYLKFFERNNVLME